jgi:hypothetical protein
VKNISYEFLVKRHLYLNHNHMKTTAAAVKELQKTGILFTLMYEYGTYNVYAVQLPPTFHNRHGYDGWKVHEYLTNKEYQLLEEEKFPEILHILDDQRITKNREQIIHTSEKLGIDRIIFLPREMGEGSQKKILTLSFRRDHQSKWKAIDQTPVAGWIDTKKEWFAVCEEL